MKSMTNESKITSFEEALNQLSCKRSYYGDVVVRSPRTGRINDWEIRIHETKTDNFIILVENPGYYNNWRRAFRTRVRGNWNQCIDSLLLLLEDIYGDRFPLYEECRIVLTDDDGYTFDVKGVIARSRYYDPEFDFAVCESYASM